MISNLHGRSPRAALIVVALIALTSCSSGEDRVSADPPVPTGASGSATDITSTEPGSPEGTRDGVLVEGDDPAGGASPLATDGLGALVDATGELGLDEALIGLRGHAVAVADIDGDGWDDLFVGTFADRPVETYQHRGADGPAPDQVLFGSADGFTPDPDFAGRLGRTAGASFADLDGDGDQDLIVSRNVRSSERGSAPSEIYRNDGGALVPATVLDDERGGRAVGVVDADGDGLLDLVLVEDRWTGASTAIFRNEGDLQFRDATTELGFPTDVWGLGIDVGDLNGDGRPDLVIGGSNRWFLADDGGYVEGPGSPLPWPLDGPEDDPAHVELVDLNDDGSLDVLIGQHFNSTVDAGRPEPIRLYLNEGPGPDGSPSFRDVTETSGLAPLTTKSPRVLVVDIDGDGRRDLVTTASSPDDPTRPIILEATGVQDDIPSFRAPDGTAEAHYWVDAALLDANGDGHADIFLVEWEPTLGSRLLIQSS